MSNICSRSWYRGRMTMALQASLFDAPDTPTSLGDLDGAVERTTLTHGAWVDVCPGWVRGSSALFDHLVDDVPWRGERRQMYERMVDVPRLLAFYDEGDALPHPVLEEARAALSEYYRAELKERFCTAGLCLYRDGRDSVAWHGDTIGRGRRDDTMVAIVSLGTPRPLLLRPRGGPGGAGGRGGRGGGTRRYTLGHGDLLVMGGSCQRTWEHAVPKTARPLGPRISVQFRPRGVR